jgi:hypothetical protein
MIRALFIIPASLGAAVLLAAVCGGGDRAGEFAIVPYTVVPATVVPGQTRDAVVAIDPSRDPGDDGLDNVYIADLVNAAVRNAETDAFQAALREYGLTDYYSSGDPPPESSNTTQIYMVWVPRGAALSAMPVIAAMPGVEEAWISYLGTMIRPIDNTGR